MIEKLTASNDIQQAFAHFSLDLIGNAKKQSLVQALKL